MTKGANIIASAEAYTNILSQGALALAVADAYDAMTSDRPYRPAMPPEAACSELVKGKGKQFAPIIIDTFMSLRNKSKKTMNFIPKLINSRERKK
jgi:HD-GYP domain-containing protein (c-di-GMP phosphodiesterase class II)